MINNEFYKDLGEAWFTAKGDAVALLRYENIAKLKWTQGVVAERFGARRDLRVLDVGCGGGFLSLGLAQDGFSVTAMDVSHSVMAPGQRRDVDDRIHWVEGHAQALPFQAGEFDVVCAMDLLEHVEDPEVVVRECARVLAPGGSVLLHTFNRTWLSWALADKGLNWWIKGTPPDIHDWRMFITPFELQDILERCGLGQVSFTGIQPVLGSTAFFRLLCTRRVPTNFRFQTGGGLSVGYLAHAH